MSDTRLIPCDACKGEGRDIRIGIVYEPGCGHPHSGEVDRGSCPVCNGEGVVEVEDGPITPNDFDDQPAA